ncbi:MAG: hypothetical protein M3R02_18085 [Chloroflexota bacterium]|nr:hypothetical protein [Chloroflexota bacterium]
MESVAEAARERDFCFVAITYPELFPSYKRPYQSTNASAEYLGALERRIARSTRFAEDTMGKLPPPLAAPTRPKDRVPVRTGQFALPL